MKSIFTKLSVFFVLLIISSFSFAAKVANNNGNLPVKYISFTGNTTVTGNVVLNWITENDTKNDHYEVERSFNGTDFTQVGIVLDGFENGAQKEYAFKDNSAALKGQAIAYYRFKQIDNNGKFTYGSNVVVNLKKASATVQVSSTTFSTTQKTSTILK